jgi:flagellar biosynthesis protein FlhG
MNSNLFPGNGDRPGRNRCEIWAVGGGKGGTGKTFLTSCMGTSLARKGRKVVLIDADLGGSNLHSFFGIDRPKYSLTDFLESGRPLKELVVDTGINHMGLISGHLNSFEANGVKYTQKQKLFRHIRALDADYILIDLGAGSHNNTLDTFLLADRMIVVIVPELTSVENMYQFVKSALFRKLKLSSSIQGLKDVIQDAWKNHEALGIRNLRDLVGYLRGISPDIRNVVDEELEGFRLDIVLNQVKSDQEIKVGPSVKSVCLKHFGFNTCFAGHVVYDGFVSRSINRRQPFMLTYPMSRCAKGIEAITGNLMGQEQAGAEAGEYARRRL